MNFHANRFGWTLLLVAGAGLGWIALRAPEPTYVVPAKAAPASIPARIEQDVPEGFVLRTFHVDGICCQGCGGKLYAKALGVEGVSAAAVDTLKQEVAVLVPEDVGDAELLTALTFDKYRASAR
jgi:copper chaperone CopZ